MKNLAEELTVHILFTLVVGYFANAQYDVLFIPYRHFVPLPPKEEARFVFARKQSDEAISREGGKKLRHSVNVEQASSLTRH